ncbi:hypothetical protein Ancab_038599 [Ancistrocladus abbreviatus]
MLPKIRLTTPPSHLHRAVFIALLTLSLLSPHPILSLSILSLSALSQTFYHLFRKPYAILLLNYSCYKPPSHRKCTYELSEYFVRKTARFSAKSEDFMRSIYLKSGLGNETYAPPFLFDIHDDSHRNPRLLESAFEEAREGMFSAVDALLGKTQIHPRRIDIVIVVSGSFSPSPSLSSMLVNRYELDEGVRTFNLSGMGCSGGVVAVDMAVRLLSARRAVQYALVVITESISLNWYFGENRSMLVTNCIFRVGCAAALISNDPSQHRVAKFKLVDSLRTHHGSDDRAYRAAFQEEDEVGTTGISLTKDLIRVAGENLRHHITTLAPRVLPLGELIKYAKSVVLSALSKGELKRVDPDFTTAFEHMCIHTGGKAVIERIGRVLKLSDSVTEPARMTLHRFGNTSSSLVFYELAYVEAKTWIKSGNRLWMLAFGTGFKVGSLVWISVRDSDYEFDNPWNDCIHRYPVKSW